MFTHVGRFQASGHAGLASWACHPYCHTGPRASNPVLGVVLYYCHLESLNNFFNWVPHILSPLHPTNYVVSPVNRRC